jgi:hypothetical protein
VAEYVVNNEMVRMWKEAVVVQFQMIHHHQHQTTVAVDVQAGTGNRQNTRHNITFNKTRKQNSERK